MKIGWGLLLGVIGGLLGAGLLFLIISRPRGQSVTLQPPPTPPPLVVHVNGAVIQPGLYNLPAGSRINDAVEAAGGLLAEANLQSINLADFLTDGQRVFIPAQVSNSSADSGSTTAPTRGDSPPLVLDPGIAPLVDINTASLEELDSLPGIGETRAQAIIDYRTSNGLFPSIEAIQDVPGIGPGIFEQIADLITVSGVP